MIDMGAIYSIMGFLFLLTCFDLYYVSIKKKNHPLNFFQSILWPGDWIKNVVVFARWAKPEERRGHKWAGFFNNILLGAYSPLALWLLFWIIAKADPNYKSFLIEKNSPCLFEGYVPLPFFLSGHPLGAVPLFFVSYSLTNLLANVYTYNRMGVFDFARSFKVALLRCPLVGVGLSDEHFPPVFDDRRGHAVLNVKGFALPHRRLEELMPAIKACMGVNFNFVPSAYNPHISHFFYVKEENREDPIIGESQSPDGASDWEGLEWEKWR